jgi:hypothetical protein
MVYTLIENNELYIQHPYKAEQPISKIPALDPAEISSMETSNKVIGNCINGKNTDTLSEECKLDKLESMKEINRLSYIRIALAIALALTLALVSRMKIYTVVYSLLVLSIITSLLYSGYIFSIFIKNRTKMNQCDEEIERLPPCALN